VAGAPVSAADLAIPEAARNEFEKATQALQNHDLDEGIAHLKKAIELHDPYPQAYTMLGTPTPSRRNGQRLKVPFRRLSRRILTRRTRISNWARH